MEMFGWWTGTYMLYSSVLFTAIHASFLTWPNSPHMETDNYSQFVWTDTFSPHLNTNLPSGGYVNLTLVHNVTQRSKYVLMQSLCDVEWEVKFNPINQSFRSTNHLRDNQIWGLHGNIVVNRLRYSTSGVEGEVKYYPANNLASQPKRSRSDIISQNVCTCILSGLLYNITHTCPWLCMM